MQPPSSPAPWRVVRIMVFADRPDVLLFYVPEGTELALPAGLRAPFTKKTVADAFAGARVPVRVTESVPGRWTDSIVMMRKAERSERAQREHQAQATRAALERSGPPAAQSRAAAIQAKLTVDAKAREVKAWLAEAKSRAYTRNDFVDPQVFRAKERELEVLKQESQALQTRLGELRKEEAAANRAASQDEHERFRRAAYRVLPRELFEAILDEMAGDDEEDEDGPEGAGADAPAGRVAGSP